MQVKRWGMPYKGSKNKIAQWVVDALPPNEHLYDIFCGGCAVTHCALYSTKWKHYHINDINPMMPTAFWDAAHGKFKDDYRWISREDFFRLKDTDAMAAMCYSFGNDLRSYLYAKELEPFKKACHYAVCFGDMSLIEKYDVDMKALGEISDISKRYKAFRHIIKEQEKTECLYRKL